MAFLAIVGSNPTLSARADISFYSYRRFPARVHIHFPFPARAPMRKNFLIIGGFLIALLHVAITVIGGYADTFSGGYRLLSLLP
jgi:hypothetical protein